MSDYTPTTEEVRDAWAEDCNCPGHKEQRDLFDRWLAEVKAQAWDEGAYVGYKYHMRMSQDLPTESANPYRQGEN